MDNDGSATLIRRAASLKLAAPSDQHILYPSALFSVSECNEESLGPSKHVHRRPVHFARSPTYVGDNGETGQSRSKGAQDSVRNGSMERGQLPLVEPDKKNGNQ